MNAQVAERGRTGSPCRTAEMAVQNGGISRRGRQNGRSRTAECGGSAEIHAGEE